MQSSRRAINQGDLYWVAPDSQSIAHPCVVVQEDLFNHSRVESVIVCALTSNVKRVSYPGNVLLEAGEANLSRPSVVEVSKISAVEKARLGEYIGTLSAERVRQILAGIAFQQTLRGAEDLRGADQP